MNYDNMTREQLLDRIEELEVLNRELLMQKEQEDNLDFAWSGNLGHWYWNIKTDTVTFNHLKVTTLGYDKSEIPEQVTYKFFTNKLHPDDYENTMNVMLNHLRGKTKVYEVEYRIQAKDGKYKWYYDMGKITQYDTQGKPVLVAGIVFDITKRKESEIDLENKNKILTEQATLDGLTKINNRRILIEKLKSEVSYSGIMSKPLSVAIFDIDDFKNINDSNGHVFGDKVIVGVANIISNNIRNTDFVGRYGGEEFMVIFPNTDLANASKIAERIRKSVEENVFAECLKTTISGGVKEYSGENLMDFVNFADMNLYEAKKRGKNKIVDN